MNTNPFSLIGCTQLRKLKAQAQAIIDLAPSFYELSNSELQAKTKEFRSRIDRGETLDDMMFEAFATVREASRRTIGMEHYPVQIVGGIVLHKGMIAEMKTGEGKTLVSTLPAYLNGLSGMGVHVITVNDYLAKRDCELMRPVYEFLGLSVESVLNGMGTAERQQAYGSDITYLTNSELGFDYLRDNMAKSRDELVLRGLNYCIIDEIDSVLIDDARTPLIISGAMPRSTAIYQVCDVLARNMERGDDLPELTKIDLMAGVHHDETGHFIVSEKDKRIVMTELGMNLTERFFRIDNIADMQNILVMHHMDLALRAHYLMEKDRDYIVKDKEVLIVDQNTGRVMKGRRFSDGLHQAIEAKERVPIQKESRTIATITYQSLFNKYKKKSGMTGTAGAEATEFRETYHMDIVSIPTQKPILRIDTDDVVFRTKKEKLGAICDAIEQSRQAGRPVLVGTSTVSESEELSSMLKTRGLDHRVLNAKHHEAEAAIVAEAGKKAAVTIATNMAGRGTDITLDEEARDAGGLLVIGSERAMSSRIDDQLRGRSGRQGDPGESRFYISLEDELLSLFGEKKMRSIFDSLKTEEEKGICNPLLTKAIVRAQKAVEGRHYEQRKRTLDFDKVLDLQRSVIYEQRRELLEADDMRAIVLRFIELAVDDTFDEQAAHGKPEERDSRVKELVARYEAMELESDNPDKLHEHERTILLNTVDEHWSQHMEDLDQLRMGIGLLSYANLDPVTEYQIISSKLFDAMCRDIRIDCVTGVLGDMQL